MAAKVFYRFVSLGKIQTSFAHFFAKIISVRRKLCSSDDKNAVGIVSRVR